MTTTLRLAALLSERGLTQTAAAEKAGLSFQAVNYLCSGRAKFIALDTIDRLAKALGMEPGELFERKAVAKRGSS